MKRFIKIIKYLGISTAVLVVSSVIGQKNTDDYSFFTLVHADVPAPPAPGDFGGDGCSDSGAGSGSGGGDGGDGSDGCSSDGGASGADGVADVDIRDFYNA